MSRNLKTEVGGEVHLFDENDLRNTASSNATNFTILLVITESQRQFLEAIYCGDDSLHTNPSGFITHTCIYGRQQYEHGFA